MMKKFLRTIWVSAVGLALAWPMPQLQAQPAPKTIEITAHRFSYEPAAITLKVGEPVVLVLKSEDVAHGLRIRELGVEFKVGAHATAQAQVTPTTAGDFVGHCYVFCGSGHASMALTVHVVE